MYGEKEREGGREQKESKEWGKEERNVGSRERRNEGGKGWKESRCFPGIVLKTAWELLMEKTILDLDRILI